MHIAQSINLLFVHGYNFVNFIQIVEMLLACTVIVANGVPVYKKHSQCTDTDTTYILL